METTMMGYIGTTLRMHSSVPSYLRVKKLGKISSLDTQARQTDISPTPNPNTQTLNPQTQRLNPKPSNKLASAANPGSCDQSPRVFSRVGEPYLYC